MLQALKEEVNMTTITPGLIKELRDRTGIGMAKCKEALEQAGGDIELAIANLRKAGMASAVKKEGRETKEGMIGVADNGKAIAIVEINAETDFVVKNDRFKEFLDAITQEAVATAPASLEDFIQQPYSKDRSLTIDQYRATLVQAIGENIQIRRLVILKREPNHSLGLYSHLGGKIVTVVDIQGSDKEEAIAKDIAMHTAASAPEYLAPTDVPQDIIASEKEIAKSQMKDKPAFVVDKIIDGKLASFFEANCLICQKYIKNDAITIKDLVNSRGKEVGKELSIPRYIRWNVGQ